MASFLKILDSLGQKETKSSGFPGPSSISSEAYKSFIRLGQDQTGFISASRAYSIYNENSAVSDAVDTIAEGFSLIEPVIIKDKSEVITQHKVLEFLEFPNNLDPYDLFAERIASNFLIDGNAYLEIIGNVKSFPAEIYPVKNNYVSITEGANTASYLVTATDVFQFLSGTFVLDLSNGRIMQRGFTETAIKEIYHIKKFYDSTSTLRSISKLASIQRDSAILGQSDAHNLASLTKGFNSSGILSIKTEDQSVIEQIARDIAQNKSGAGNAGDIIVSQGDDMKYSSISQNNKDMQLNETKKDSRSTIYQRYDIPKPLVDGDAQKYQNYQTALYALFDSAVIPVAKRVFNSLTKVFRDRGALQKNERIGFDITSILALQLRLMEEVKIRKELELESTNELRTVIGKEEVEGGDDILITGNRVPLTKDSFTEDNRTEPSRKFIEVLKDQGFTDPEVKDAWSRYSQCLS